MQSGRLLRSLPKRVGLAVSFICLVVVLATGLLTPPPADAREAIWGGEESDGRINEDVNKSQGHNNFKFIQISDPHVGTCVDDFGTDGYDDHQIGFQQSPGEVYLGTAANWVRMYHSNENIRFLAVTGDITSSGERSEFERAKAILDTAGIPYVTVAGNHDMRPYTEDQGHNAPYAFGDDYMRGVFAPNMARLQQAFPQDWENGRWNVATWDPEVGHNQYFQCYAFDYNEYRFIVTDYNTRNHSSLYYGTLPEADCHNFSGGTYEHMYGDLDWAVGQTRYTQHNDHIFILDHHPMAPIEGYSLFTSSEHGLIGNNLRPHQNQIGRWLSGHTHWNRSWYLNHDWWTICPGDDVAGEEGDNLMNCKVYTLYGVTSDVGWPAW